MKKKMLFICAAGLLTVGIASAIESANIVGYQKIEGGGKMLLTSPFVSVLSPDQKFTLSQLTGNFQDLNTIELLNAAGNVISKAYYWRDDGEWYDWDSDELMSTNSLLAGTAMIVTAVASFNGFFAGQVEEDEILLPLNTGKTLIGNGSPVTLELGQLVFSGLRDLDAVEFLNAAGNVVAKAYYWRDDGEWYNWDDDDFASDWPLFPGEGFIVTCGGGSVKIPTAL